jgi:hypothetical protein
MGVYGILRDSLGVYVKSMLSLRESMGVYVKSVEVYGGSIC